MHFSPFLAKRKLALFAPLLAALSHVCPVTADTNTEKVAPVSDFFMVSRIDLRLCTAPQCGGYFVKRVNTNVARCADGSWQAECHAYRIRFPNGAMMPGNDSLTASLGNRQRLGLSSLLGQSGRLLMRGHLETRELKSGVTGSVLNVSEAWAGRSGKPPRGHFSRLEPLDQICISDPCAHYVERSLNTNLVDFLANVQWHSRLDPLPPDNETIPPNSTLLAVGTHRRVTGPAGAMNQLLASEIYQPLFFTMTPE